MSQTSHMRARKIKNSLFGYLCFFAALIAVLLLLILLAKIWTDGKGKLSLDFIKNFDSFRPTRAGIKAAVVGSGLIMLITALTAVPIGVAAAIYLEEFQAKKNWFVHFIQINIANLAGVPSIVYGILGLAVFVGWFGLGRSVISGAFTMSLLILPMVIIVSQEALRAVPKSLREGSLALGTTKWQTIRHQVLPNAASGIFTGIILSLSRAIGETAPLIVVGAFGYINFLPKSVDSAYTVLPIQIFFWSSQPNKQFHEAAASAIVVLLAVLLILNSVAIYLRYRSRKTV